jgi:folate-binding protein YgfZ
VAADDGAAAGYAAAREGAALAELTGRELLVVSGPHRQRFLHNILSNDVAGRQPGQGSAAALMDVKGHLVATLRVLVADSEVLLELPPGRADVVEPLLVHYRVGAPVRFARRAAALFAVMGPVAGDVLGRAGAAPLPGSSVEDHVSSSVDGMPVRVVRAGDLPLPGFVLHAAADDAARVRDALVRAGASVVGSDTLDVLRIEAGRPWYGPDIGPENLLHETGLVPELHSPTKGCYVGQEVIARLEARGGNVNKMMRRLRLSAEAEAGAVVLFEGREVGRLTTSGVSPRLGPVALGYLHRSRAELGTVVEVGGGTATVEGLGAEQR